jgi:hypothetical protein
MVVLSFSEIYVHGGVYLQLIGIREEVRVRVGEWESERREAGGAG